MTRVWRHYSIHSEDLSDVFFVSFVYIITIAFEDKTEFHIAFLDK